jgi:hypothetical protein
MVEVLISKRMATDEEVKETATDWLNGPTVNFCEVGDRTACAMSGQMPETQHGLYRK